MKTTTHQWLTLQISIEKRTGREVINWNLSECSSTEFSAQIYTDDLIKDTIKAINTLKGFDMLTVNLCQRSDGDYNGGQELTAYRIVGEFSGYKFAKAGNDHAFRDWSEHAETLQQSQKRIKNWIKELTDQANAKFIELLKERSKAA